MAEKPDEFREMTFTQMEPPPDVTEPFFDGIPNNDRKFYSDENEPHEIGVLSGVRYVNLLDIDPDTIRLADIAHALAMTIRFNGNVAFPITVATHSVGVATVGRNRARELGEPEEVCEAVYCWGLLHDGHEYVVGDHARPFIKAMDAKTGGLFSEALGEIKQEVDNIVAEKSGYAEMFDAQTRGRAFDIVKRADRESTQVERGLFQWDARRLRDQQFHNPFPQSHAMFMASYMSSGMKIF